MILIFRHIAHGRYQESSIWKITLSQLFGPLGHLGFVVRDIESAMRSWTTKLRIGPFYHIERMPIIDFRYRGALYRPQISVALTYSGNLQIELIQQIDQTPSTYRDFLAAGQDGVHDIGFFSEHYDLDLQRAAEGGLRVEQTVVIESPVGKATYFSAQGRRGTVVKLAKLDSGSRELYQMVRTEAGRWDGSGPVRSLEL